MPHASHREWFSVKAVIHGNHPARHVACTCSHRRHRDDLLHPQEPAIMITVRVALPVFVLALVTGCTARIDVPDLGGVASGGASSSGGSGQLGTPVGDSNDGNGSMTESSQPTASCDALSACL